MPNKENRRPLFIFFGILFLLFSGLFGTASISTGRFPVGDELVLFAVSVMSFCNAYLYPQFKENDERTRLIKEKGMFVSYFFILGYMMIFLTLFACHALNWNGFQTVSALAALTIMTVFLSFVYFSKRY